MAQGGRRNQKGHSTRLLGTKKTLRLKATLIRGDRMTKKEWIIIGFDHPTSYRSLIYKQRIRRTETLLAALEEGINAGCNLFSIRGVEVPAPTVSAVSKENELQDSLMQPEMTETGTAAQEANHTNRGIERWTN